MDMIEKVAATIRRHGLVSTGEAVLVALSGGPDSVALFHVLTCLKAEMKLRLGAVHINHQLRSAAVEDERLCARLCQNMEVEFSVVREDVKALAEAAGTGLEETAREFRYGVLERLAGEDGYDRIALGHHADDQAETVLFRVLRGTGRRGLGGIPVERGKIIRPLLEIEREEILAYLDTHDIPFCRDVSNFDTTFKRNYLRHDLLPSIRKNLNPLVDRSLRNLADTLRAEEAFLESHVDRAWPKVAATSPGGKIGLALEVFCSYDTWLRRRLLRRCLTSASSCSQGPDKAVIERLDQACLRRLKRLSLPEGMQAVCVDDRMVLGRAKAGDYERELVRSQRTEVPGLGYCLRYRVIDWNRQSPVRTRGSRTVFLDWEKLSPPLVVRNARPGDRFQPLGLNGSKKVGNYLTDRKVPLVFRDEIPMVCDRKGIIWLVGFEIADRVKIDQSTRKVARIECTNRRADRAQTV